VAGAHYGIANILAQTGDPNGALENYQEAIAIRKSGLSIANPAQSTSLRTHLAADYTGTARVLADQGQFESAIKAQQQAAALLEELCTADPINATLRGFLADSYQLLGSDLKDNGDLQRGVHDLRQAKGIYQSLSAADPSNALIRYRIGYVDISLGDGLLKQKHSAEGIQNLREALSLFQHLAETDSANNYSRSGLADVYSSIGTAYEKLATKHRLSPSAQLQDWQIARANYQKSLDTLNDLRHRIATEQENPEITRLEKNIATCDEALANLRDVNAAEKHR
jgi:tetratricopeptide (TPR) repeat protein